MKTWEIPGDLVAKSVEHMRPYGTRGHEALALWFGDETDGTVSITHLVLPYGPGLTTHPLRLILSMRAMSRITRLAGELNRYWAGQIHSHPGTMIGLSDIDKEMGVRVQDYVSVVCPYYAQRETREVEECGVHVFDCGAYRQLAASEAAKRIAVSDRRAEVVTVEVLA